MRLQDLAERPEGDPLPVGEAASLPPGREVGTRVDVAKELGHQAALAEPRLPDDGDELDGARGDGLVEDPLQEGEIDLAPDEGRVVPAGEVGSEAGAGGFRLEHPHRRLLTLERCGLELLVVEHGRGRLVGRKTDRYAQLRGDRLDPRGGVDRIPREQTFTETCTRPETHQRLAGVDPYPQAQGLAPDRLELLRALDDPKPRPHRPLGVVLVRGGDTEHAHHRVPDELLDHSPVGLDPGAGHLGVRAQHPVDVLGVGVL